MCYVPPSTKEELYNRAKEYGLQYMYIIIARNTLTHISVHISLVQGGMYHKFKSHVLFATHYICHMNIFSQRFFKIQNGI